MACLLIGSAAVSLLWHVRTSNEPAPGTGQVFKLDGTGLRDFLVALPVVPFERGPYGPVRFEGPSAPQGN